MLLSAEQLTKTYGTRVLLDGVSFYVEPGDKVGIIGVNGCGKSTLLRVLAGAEEPDGGTVRPDPNVRLAYLPQNPVFPGEHTVLEQVLLGLDGDDRALAEYEAKTILNQLGVPRFDQKMEELSGGGSKEDAARIFDNVLRRRATPAQEQCVVVNAAFAIQVLEPAKEIAECINLARESLESGRALEMFQRFITLNS